ncbi:MAG: SDR family oxidoreductase [Betaproteobacteria bacterium]
MDEGVTVRPIGVVTGAESGIGRATAIAFAEAGYEVGFTWLSSEQAAEASAAEIRRRGGRAVHRRLDLVAPMDGGRVVDELIDELGHIDVFVNNAATGHSAAFLDTTLEDWMRVVSVNLTGPFVCAQAAARRMVQQDTGGAIVNVTSVQDTYPVRNSSAYGAAKGGLRQLTRTMAIELGAHGIRVNAVAPGEVNTAMNRREGVPAADVARPALPLGRVASPNEVAAAIVWLASDASSYLTGATIVVDGGAVLMGPDLATGH